MADEAKIADRNRRRSAREYFFHLKSMIDKLVCGRRAGAAAGPLWAASWLQMGVIAAAASVMAEKAVDN